MLPEIHRTAHCLRRLYLALGSHWEAARAHVDPLAGLEEQRRLNDLLGDVAVQEVELGLGRWLVDSKNSRH